MNQKQTNEKIQEVEKKQKRKTSPIRFLVGIVILAVVAVMVYSIYREIMVTLNLRADINQVNQEIATLSEEKESLESQKAKLNDPAYVEQYARGKYKLTKEGETIYKLPGKTTTDSEGGE